MYREYQIKLAGTIGTEFLLLRGAKQLGHVVQQDVYLKIDGETWRIRSEGGNHYLAKKGYDIGRQARVKEVEETSIESNEVERLVNDRGVKMAINKTRTLFDLQGAIIAQDDVEHLGQFTEIHAQSEEYLIQILELLGLSHREPIKKSYLEMMEAKALPLWLRIVLRLHDRIGEFSFGIISGVLTALGALTGVDAATSSKLSTFAAVIAIAVADSCSDAYGMYIARVSERGSSRKKALRCALGTLAGKFILPITFALPMLAMSLRAAVCLDFVWGTAVLSLLSAEQAVVEQRSVIRRTGRNLVLAAFIIIISAIVGSLVAKLGV